MVLKTSPLLAALLLLGNVSPSAAQVEKSLYKLGLISGEKERKNESDQEKRYREEVLNAATDAFVAARRFTMVERNQLDAIFTEKSLQDFIGGQVNNKLTDVLGLDLVGVIGYTVEKPKPPKGANGEEAVPKCTIDVRLIDVKTASILATVTSDRPDLALVMPSSNPREAGQILYKSIRDAFPPLGYVVSVSGKDIIIDLGTEAGLKNGDTLEIVQEGEQIIHPVTGKLLSAPMKVIGELKVVTASAQVSTCKSKSKVEVPIASLVRLKGSHSLILDWAAKIPFLKKSAEDKKKEVDQ